MASISANGSKGHHKFTLNVTQSATDVATNTSTLSFEFKLSPIYTSWNWYEWSTHIAYTITINGTNYSGYIPDYDGYSIVTLKTGTQSVKHNDDGSKSISYSFSVTDATGQSYTPGYASASGTFALASIPRASTISSVSGTTIGGAMTVNISRAVSTFTHQMWYKVGNSEWYDLGKDIGTSKKFNIDIITANQITNSMTGTLQLCVRTYNGTTVIGSDYYKDVTVSVPDYTPTISAIKLTGNNLLSGEYVSGKSTVTAEITAASMYGATIKSYSATVDGKTHNGNKFTSAILTSGNKTVSVTVTDTRGKTVTAASSAIAVRDYTNPVITEFTLARQSDGATVIATVKGNVSAVNNKNAKVIQVTLNGVTQAITSSSYAINGTTTFTNVPTDNTLTSTAQIIDSYTRAVQEYVLPTVAVTMDFLADGKGIAMGKVAETSDLLEVAWNERIHKNLEVDGNTNLNKATTISDSDWKTLILKRLNAVGAVTINFQNNTGSLGFIGMTGSELNSPLRRWSSDGATQYTVLDSAFVKDYVVEQGTSGMWTYRKWNSGIAECFGIHPVTSIAVNSAWGALYSSPQITLPNFPFAFAAVPGVTITWNGSYSVILDGATGVTTQRSGYTYFFRPDSVTSLTGSIIIRAHGKWK